MSAQAQREALSQALSFLTPLRMHDDQPSPAAMAWFAPVGAAIGTAVASSAALARSGRRSRNAGVLAVIVDIVATGGLHLDGLADAADGLLAHGADHSRLEIMADPAVGMYGSLALLLATLAKERAFSSAELRIGYVACLYGISRSLMVVGSRLLPYARAEGLASAFLSEGADDPALRGALLGIAGGTLGAFAIGKARGGLAALAGLAAGAAVLGLARRRIAGFTGDVLGACGVVCESVALLVATS